MWHNKNMWNVLYTDEFEIWWAKNSVDKSHIISYYLLLWRR
ncbi:hypothetical protein GMMP15_850008 [Candidatus Magnetomoraceae bacterium gMMP-15]